MTWYTVDLWEFLGSGSASDQNLKFYSGDT